MRGDQVVVRAFGDEALVRRIWRATEGVVFIVSDQNFRTLLAGEEGLWPIGFRREDVFEYDEDAIQELEAHPSGRSLNWEHLHHWTYQAG